MSMTSGGAPGSHLAAELGAMDNNIYGFMHNASDLESLARTFARLGWQARRSAEGEYEVECWWCQVNLFDSGGMPKFAGVVEPTRVDELADIFRSLDVDYEIELYDVEGELVRKILP
ncbi:hypothetical protein [Couchioplanes azureus]|uniref:hypothetical protein n=1 Tax=Couchioplanes caeruleus TaxID=56438 RepID=UPI00166F6AAE|nr:hypothetical protein [Couchioplanes caeruleus]GGQ73495.1 hypothetical protein GCM10010166_49440 [Couchioplanes caeruleus subsp. azureus]